MAKLTPMKAIRKKRLECSGGSAKEVRECKVRTCALFAYRSGEKPKGDKYIVESISEEKNRFYSGGYELVEHNGRLTTWKSKR